LFVCLVDAFKNSGDLDMIPQAKKRGRKEGRRTEGGSDFEKQ
jgi:hypothetical protein